MHDYLIQIAEERDVTKKLKEDLKKFQFSSTNKSSMLENKYSLEIRNL